MNDNRPPLTPYNSDLAFKIFTYGICLISLVMILLAVFL